jgi:acyl-CoA thioesterase-1
MHAIRLTGAPGRPTYASIMRFLHPVLFVAAALVPGVDIASAADGLKLLAFGDSLTHGYGLADKDTFPRQLERALRAKGLEVTVINGGNSGDTSSAALARVNWVLEERPDAVILELGSNDALRGLAPEEMEANLAAILDIMAERYIPTLLTGMVAPRNLGEDYTEAYDAVFPALADRFDVAFYPFFLDGVALDPDLNQADGIHPNARGVAVIVERILPSVIGLIEDHEATRDKAGLP